MSIRSHAKGFLFAIAGSFFAATMAVLVKLSGDIPNETLIFFRNIVCLVIILPPLFYGKYRLHTKRFGLHMLRSFCGLVSIYCYFYAVKNLPIIVDAIILSNTIPLFIPLVVLFWLHLKIPMRRVLALLLGFLGVLLILQPGKGLFHGPILAELSGLGTGLLGAVAFVGVRQLSKTENTELILFYYFSTCVVLSFFPMLFFWKPIVRWQDWLIIFAIGVVSVLYQLCITRGFKHAPATKVSSILYCSIVFGGAFGWILWEEIPNIWVLFGVAFIVCGSLLALLDKKEPVRMEWRIRKRKKTKS